MAYIIYFLARYKIGHLRKLVNHHKIESFPPLDQGKPKIKSIEISIKDVLK